MAKGTSKKHAASSTRSATDATAPMAAAVTTVHAVALEEPPRLPAARLEPQASLPRGTHVDGADGPVLPAPTASLPVVEWVAEIATSSMRTLQAVLPTGRTPLVLLGMGLVIVGAVELPVVVGAGLAYEGLRRWQPRYR